MRTEPTAGRSSNLVFAGLDESGSLTADSAFFCMAVVITPDPLSVRHLIRRGASRAGKRLGRPLKNAAEIKWSNASLRIRASVLAELAEADVDIFALDQDRLNALKASEAAPGEDDTLICPDAAMAPWRCSEQRLQRLKRQHRRGRRRL